MKRTLAEALQMLAGEHTLAVTDSYRHGLSLVCVVVLDGPSYATPCLYCTATVPAAGHASSTLVSLRAETLGVSSVHVAFCLPEEASIFTGLGWLTRRSVQ